MSQRSVTILSVVLTIACTLAFNTGHYVLGALGIVASGVLTVYVGPQLWKRIVGGCMIVYGLYVLALVLGFLIHASLGFIDKQTALYVGAFLFVVGLQIVRRVPKHRKIGLVLMAIGGLLAAYGAGYLG